MINDITIIIPSIPIRAQYLSDALQSVARQTHLPDQVLVRIANDKKSAPEQRDEMLSQVKTQWIACLDDDDYLLPNHLDVLLRCAKETEADMVYPWYTVEGGSDPFAHFFGVPWDNSKPHQVPITNLYNTELVRSCGGWSNFGKFDVENVGTSSDGQRAGEDYCLLLRMIEAGAKIVHIKEKTWVWRHHDKNTSGRPAVWS